MLAFAAAGLSAAAVADDGPAKAENRADAHAEQPHGEKAGPHPDAAHAGEHNGDHGKEGGHGGADGHDAHHAHAGHHEHIGEKGVNKQPEEFKPDLAVYSFLVFMVLFAALAKFAWGPILEGLKKREQGVLSNIAAAEASNLKAKKLLEQYDEKLALAQEDVRRMVAEARKDADSTRERLLAEAQRDVEAVKRRATEEIERARSAAIDELFDYMARCVTNASSQVIGRSLSGDDHDRLVNEAVSQFTKSQKA
jgi:F-type H+-transporting ATPase subunit b